MDEKATVLMFDGYVVNYFSFVQDANYELTGGEIETSPSLRRVIEKSEDGRYIVKLLFKLSSDEEKKVPFKLDAGISGYFKLPEGTKDEENAIKHNAVAILFPYLRALISSITVNANIPSLILPVMNVAAMMDEQEKSDGVSNL